MKEELLSIIHDLRYFTLIPRRYRTARGKGEEYWSKVMRAYKNAMKEIGSMNTHWHVIEYKDGHCELAYLRVLQGGIFSGLRPAIYRGVIIPRMVRFGTFDHIDRIRLAF